MPTNQSLNNSAIDFLVILAEKRVDLTFNRVVDFYFNNSTSDVGNLDPTTIKQEKAKIKARFFQAVRILRKSEYKYFEETKNGKNFI